MKPARIKQPLTRNSCCQPISKIVLATLLTWVLFVIIALTNHPVRAENMTSDSYIIQFGNFNVTSGEKSSASFTVTDTVGQVGAGPYGQYGASSYFLGGGFQYIYQIPEFRFSISKLAIDLGEIAPNTHNSDSNTLTISTAGAGGYTVYAYEQNELKHTDGNASIANTNCNSGCSISSAGVWTDQSKPGFGFNMDGHDIPNDFIDASYFRPFANIANSEPMQVVMQSNNIANNRQATVTYKAGIAGDQAAGNYATTIAFVAVPGY